MKFLATTSADETVKIWRTTDYAEDQVLTGHEQWVWDCAFSEDSSFLLTGASDKKAKLWDIGESGSGKDVKTFTGHGRSISAVALSDKVDM